MLTVEASMVLEVCERIIAVVLKPSTVQSPGPSGPKGPLEAHTSGERCPSGPLRKSLGRGMRPALGSVSTCECTSAILKVPR